MTIKKATLTLTLLAAAAPWLAGQGAYILGTDSWTADGTVEIYTGVVVPETEVNDSLGAADEMLLGDDYTGMISVDTDDDYVSFTATAGEIVTAETVIGGTNFDTVLWLLDGTGSVLTSDDDSGPGLLSLIQYTIPASGTYYLVVNSAAHYYTGSYLMQLRSDTPPPVSGGWLYIQRSLEAIARAVRRPNDGSVMVLGASDSTATSNDAGAAYHYAVPRAAANSPLTGVVNHFEGAGWINSALLNLAAGVHAPAVIVIPGAGVVNSLSSSESQQLQNVAGGIRDFVNSGGGLICHGNAAGTVNAFSWFATVFPGAAGVTSGVFDPKLTNEGKFEIPGLTDQEIASDAHGFFRVPHDFKVFARHTDWSLDPWSGTTITESESNGSAATANPIDIGDDYSASFALFDTDYVSFFAAAGQHITANFGGSTSPQLNLIDEDGTTVLATDWSSGTEIEFTFSSGGTYYLSMTNPFMPPASYTLQLRGATPSLTRDVVVGSLPEGWSFLGNALAGGLGDPFAHGTGTITAGSPYTLDLENARPNSTAYLVIGVAANYVPLRGGVLVPSTNIVAPVPTGPQGQISLPGSLPATLFPGVTFYLQFWVVDPTGPYGFAASNAYSMTSN